MTAADCYFMIDPPKPRLEIPIKSNSNPENNPKQSKRFPVWAIILISQTILLAAIIAAVYFLWYKPSKERDLWERQKFEQQVQVQQQQNEAQQQELKRQQAEKNRLREEEERYRNTPRGRLESEGYTYMGKCTNLWRAYEISDKTADETSGEVEVYSISNGSSTRWIVLYDGDTYQLSRGSYSKKDTFEDGPRKSFNARFESNGYVYYLNI